MPKTPIEAGIERGLFAARWLMAPFYVGMVLALIAVLFVFGKELWEGLSHLMGLNAEGVILLALSLIDLSLTGNLLLIVMFSGYETFVSHLEVAADHRDRPGWIGEVDFSGLKMKLIASIVAISAIALLRAFLPLAETDHEGGGSLAAADPVKLGWMIGLHLTFVASGVLLAAMDWIVSRTAKHAAQDRPA